MFDKTITTILKLAQVIEKNTIDNILEKDDAELGLTGLLGNLNLPD